MDDIKPEDRIVKIKYDFDHMAEKESDSLHAIIAIAIIIVVASSQVGFSPYVLFAWPYFAQGIAMIIVFFATLAYYITQRNKRMQRKKLSRTIKENGKKVIGEIVSMSETRLDSSKENFSYDIEYENPENGEISSIIITPSAALQKEMYIKEKDLPLKVIVYCYNGMTHVDAVINPPIAKMAFRKYSPSIGSYIIIILTFVSALTAAFGNIHLFIGSFVLAVVVSAILVKTRNL